MQLDAFTEWMVSTGSTPTTAKVYASAVRTTLVKMLILQWTPTRAMRRLSASGGTAWRLFLAYVRLGAVPAPGQMGLPPVGLDIVPAPILKAIRRHVQTALGDRLEAQGIGWCVRALWPHIPPSGYARAVLGSALWQQEGTGLFTLFNQNPRYRAGLSILDNASPAALRAAVHMALWSWAGASWARPGDPLLRTVPAFITGPDDPDRYIPPESNNGLWDVCGRDPCEPPPLTPEGQGLLDGEAIDLAGAAPVSRPEDLAGMRGLWSRRWSARPALTPRLRVLEHLDVAGYHKTPVRPEDLDLDHDALRLLEDLAEEGLTTRWVDAAGRPVAFGVDPGGGAVQMNHFRRDDPLRQPAGWAIVANVAGVSADGELPAGAVGIPTDPVNPGCPTDEPSRTVRTEEASLEALRSVEVPGDFDAPEFPD